MVIPLPRLIELRIDDKPRYDSQFRNQATPLFSIFLFSTSRRGQVATPPRSKLIPRNDFGFATPIYETSIDGAK